MLTLWMKVFDSLALRADLAIPRYRRLYRQDLLGAHGLLCSLRYRDLHSSSPFNTSYTTSRCWSISAAEKFSPKTSAASHPQRLSQFQALRLRQQAKRDN